MINGEDRAKEAERKEEIKQKNEKCSEKMQGKTNP